jgi:putative ABC transport system substrate-binding protein
LASALVAPGIAVAQVSNVVRRIGVLDNGSPDSPQELRQADALRELGWVEGQNLHVERRYDNGRSEALQALAEELVRAKVELIVTLGTAATLAAKRATTAVPIVFSVGDPVLLGLVGSLARPGGNLTGISLDSPEENARPVPSRSIRAHQSFIP